MKPINRDSPEFRAGMRAAAEGKTASDNPHTGWLQKKQAQSWLAGFVEPRLRARAPSFAKKPEQIDLEQVLPEEARGVLRGEKVCFTKKRR